MNVVVQHIAPTPERGAYRLLLRIGGEPLAYVVGVIDSPLVTLSAPHSFWMLCEPHGDLSRTIGSFVLAVHRGERLTLPKTVLDEVADYASAVGMPWRTSAAATPGPVAHSAALRSSEPGEESPTSIVPTPVWATSSPYRLSQSSLGWAARHLS